MVKLIFFVPVSHLDEVKKAVFSTGAGRIGHYEHCCWQTLGEGQYRPLLGSKPHLGELGVVHTLDEYKVEMVCDDDAIKSAVAALRQAHPYEEPAYEVYKLLEV